VLEQKGNSMIATKKYVTPGKSYKSKTEILSGLNEGEVIITDGYNNISDGSVVNVIK
jgi:multidrug efflux pump subunit AcrA (membrane-fusion protein)